MKLFISYSSRDREKVKALAEDLKKIVKVISRNEGGDVWFDQELIGGHDWWENILSKIRACDVFFFVITQDSLRSDPCRMEYMYAHSLHKPILPVLLGDGVNVTLLPEALQRLQFVDYRNRGVETYQALSEAMASLPPAVPMPDPLPLSPSAPISPLAQFQQQLEARSLSLETQTSLVFQLKQFLNDPEHAQSARHLLMELRKHPDTRVQIADEITSILKDTPPPRPLSGNPQAGAAISDLMNRGKEFLQPKPTSKPPAMGTPPTATPPSPQYGMPQGAYPQPQAKASGNYPLDWFKKQSQTTQVVVALVVLGILTSCFCLCVLSSLSSGGSTY